MPIVDRRKKGEAVTQKGASAIDRPTDGRTDGRRGGGARCKSGERQGQKRRGGGVSISFSCAAYAPQYISDTGRCRCRRCCECVRTHVVRTLTHARRSSTRVRAKRAGGRHCCHRTECTGCLVQKQVERCSLQNCFYEVFLFKKELFQERIDLLAQRGGGGLVRNHAHTFVEGGGQHHRRLIPPPSLLPPKSGSSPPSPYTRGIFPSAPPPPPLFFYRRLRLHPPPPLFPSLPESFSVRGEASPRAEIAATHADLFIYSGQKTWKI